MLDKNETCSPRKFEPDIRNVGRPVSRTRIFDRQGSSTNDASKLIQSGSNINAKMAARLETVSNPFPNVIPFRVGSLFLGLLLGFRLHNSHK